MVDRVVYRLKDPPQKSTSTTSYLTSQPSTQSTSPPYTYPANQSNNQSIITKRNHLLTNHSLSRLQRQPSILPTSQQPSGFPFRQSHQSANRQVGQPALALHHSHSQGGRFLVGWSSSPWWCGEASFYLNDLLTFMVASVPTTLPPLPLPTPLLQSYHHYQAYSYQACSFKDNAIPKSY